MCSGTLTVTDFKNQNSKLMLDNDRSTDIKRYLSKLIQFLLMYIKPYFGNLFWNMMGIQTKIKIVYYFLKIHNVANEHSKVHTSEWWWITSWIFLLRLIIITDKQWQLTAKKKQQNNLLEIYKIQQFSKKLKWLTVWCFLYNIFTSVVKKLTFKDINDQKSAKSKYFPRLQNS